MNLLELPKGMIIASFRYEMNTVLLVNHIASSVSVICVISCKHQMALFV